MMAIAVDVIYLSSFLAIFLMNEYSSARLNDAVNWLYPSTELYISYAKMYLVDSYKFRVWQQHFRHLFYCNKHFETFAYLSLSWRHIYLDYPYLFLQ